MNVPSAKLGSHLAHSGQLLLAESGIPLASRRHNFITSSAGASGSVRYEGESHSAGACAIWFVVCLTKRSKSITIDGVIAKIKNNPTTISDELR